MDVDDSGKTSIWCCNLIRFNQMKDIENLIMVATRGRMLVMTRNKNLKVDLYLVSSKISRIDIG